MKNLDYFANFLLKRINKKFDNVLIVDSGGIKGPGKTTFSIQLSKEICIKINYEYSFKLIIFNPTNEKIVIKVKELPVGCVIHIDESSKVAYKRDFQKEFVKELIKFINICRKFGKIVIFNNPDFWDLDKDLRNLADFRITILKRGMAQVRGKYANPEVDDKWLRKESTEIIDSHIRSDSTNIDLVISAIRKTHNYLFDIPFDELPKDEYEIYEELSKQEEVKGMLEKPDRWKIIAGACIVTLLNSGETSADVCDNINELISQYARFCNIPNADRIMINDDYVRKINQKYLGLGMRVSENNTELNNNNNSIIVKNGETAESEHI
jgi:hypothetical protein